MATQSNVQECMVGLTIVVALNRLATATDALSMTAYHFLIT